MAELLVFAADRIGDDVFKNAKLPKRGHVITIQVNNWPWGIEERTNPIFRIFKIPSVGVNTLSNLLSPEIGTVPGLDWTLLTNTLQERGFRLDMTLLSIPQSVRTYWQDDTRAAAFFTIGAAGVAAIQAAIVPVTPITNPAVIGRPAGRIG